METGIPSIGSIRARVSEASYYDIAHVSYGCNVVLQKLGICVKRL
ncbi:MAG: hypothetical protein RJA94_232 [Pseudomonadota bacterium]